MSETKAARRRQFHCGYANPTVDSLGCGDDGVRISGPAAPRGRWERGFTVAEIDTACARRPIRWRVALLDRLRAASSGPCRSTVDGVIAHLRRNLG
ncbi:MAG TPA: hypothetical protein VKA84_14590 [Gemmatimonadaceae bacterium]|nr:hypothetical protein [Gemmatimonadaceae bacterium]